MVSRDAAAGGFLEQIVARRYLLLSLPLLLGILAFGGGVQRNLVSLRLLEQPPDEPPHHCLLAPTLCAPTETQYWQYELHSNGNMFLTIHTEGYDRRSATWLVPEDRDYEVLLKGLAFFAADQRQEAIRRWQREPRIAVFMFNLAALVTDPRDATELYRISTEVSPSFKAHYQLGRLLAQIREYEDALASFRAAEARLAGAGSDDERSNYYVAFGNALLTVGDVREARDRFQKALILRSDSLAAKVGLARTELSLGEPEQAARLLEPLAVAQPGRADVHYWLARAYQSLERRVDAIKQLEEVVAVRRDFVVAWRLLGDLRFEEGNVSGAAEAYRHYLVFEPEQTEVQMRLEELNRSLESQE